jgi:hypothetical protein
MQASANAIIFNLSAWSFLACEPHPHLQYKHSRRPHLLLAAENGHDALSVEQFLIADGYTRLNNGPNKPRRLGARKVTTGDISSFVANIGQDRSSTNHNLLHSSGYMSRRTHPYITSCKSH